MLRMRSGRAPSPQQVSSVMEATEGWPLGIALVATVIGRGGAGGAALRRWPASPPRRICTLTSPRNSSRHSSWDLLEAAIDSCVTRVVTPEVARALGLDGDYRGRIERAGLMLRSIDGGKGFAYHPCCCVSSFSSASRRHAARTRGEAFTPALRRRSQPKAMRSARSSIGSRPPAGPRRSLRSKEQGPILLRTSPELLTRWLGRLPDSVQELPTIRMLEGQLLWGAGQHERAVGTAARCGSGLPRREGPRARMARAVLPGRGRVLGWAIRGDPRAGPGLGFFPTRRTRTWGWSEQPGTPSSP